MPSNWSPIATVLFLLFVFFPPLPFSRADGSSKRRTHTTVQDGQSSDLSIAHLLPCFRRFPSFRPHKPEIFPSNSLQMAAFLATVCVDLKSYAIVLRQLSSKLGFSTPPTLLSTILTRRRPFTIGQFHKCDFPSRPCFRIPIIINAKTV